MKKRMGPIERNVLACDGCKYLLHGAAINECRARVDGMGWISLAAKAVVVTPSWCRFLEKKEK